MHSTAFVSWPSTPLTRRLVLGALEKLVARPTITHSLGSSEHNRLIQWSTYDDIDHELTNIRRETVLASSYTFRKALIRKHYLAHSILLYLTKSPASILETAFPRTYSFDLAFVDELDEKWADDLYELSTFLDNEPDRWWILKPGMADRGMGIRLFNTKQALYQIFEEFELEDLEDSENFHPGSEVGGVSKTAIVTSQLRHFVIQEYILSPLLFDLRTVPVDGVPCIPSLKLRGYKFHLRAYCVASGALQLYLYDRILALFCSVPYTEPGPNLSDKALYPTDLEAHLSNTSLQTSRGGEGVKLFDELVGCQIIGENSGHLRIFTEEDQKDIIRQMIHVLAETFRAVLQTPIHFQTLENAFELYGVDFLVENSSLDVAHFQARILEVNAEPAIELTGPRLTWVLEDLFSSIAKVCVDPFIKETAVSDLYGEWNVGEAKEHFIKCLDESPRARGPSSSRPSNSISI